MEIYILRIRLFNQAQYRGVCFSCPECLEGTDHSPHIVHQLVFCRLHTSWHNNLLRIHEDLFQQVNGMIRCGSRCSDCHLINTIVGFQLPGQEVRCVPDSIDLAGTKHAVPGVCTCGCNHQKNDKRHRQPSKLS